MSSRDAGASETCASGYFCDSAVNSSHVCAKTGTCVAEGPCATACVIGHQTFCGCDGETHQACNECIAHDEYGITMAYAGACK